LRIVGLNIPDWPLDPLLRHDLLYITLREEQRQKIKTLQELAAELIKSREKLQR